MCICFSEVTQLQKYSQSKALLNFQLISVTLFNMSSMMKWIFLVTNYVTTQILSVYFSFENLDTRIFTACSLNVYVINTTQKYKRKQKMQKEKQ